MRQMEEEECWRTSRTIRTL